jgi:predicted dehydrogenase
MAKTRIYLIGTGVIASFHAGSIPALPDPENIELSAADPSPDARARFLKQNPQTRMFDNAQAMLSEPAHEDDIVIVASPACTHCELTCVALETGRHVLCEKPWAMNTGEAERMIAAAKRNKRLLGCCSCRFQGRLANEKVKEMMRTGQLGTPYHLAFVNRGPRSRPGIEYQPESKWFLDRSKNSGGCLVDWGPYDLAVLNELLSPVRVDVVGAWMTSPVTAADPRSVVFDVEEHIGAMLRYHLRNETVVSVTYERSACVHGPGCHRAELEGSKGSVYWDWLGFPQDTNKMTYFHDQDGALQTDEIAYGEKNPVSAFHKALVFFYRSVKGEQVPSVLNEEAFFNFACLRSIYDAALSGTPQTVFRGA